MANPLPSQMVLATVDLRDDKNEVLDPEALGIPVQWSVSDPEKAEIVGTPNGTTATVLAKAPGTVQVKAAVWVASDTKRGGGRALTIDAPPPPAATRVATITVTFGEPITS